MKGKQQTNSATARRVTTRAGRLGSITAVEKHTTDPWTRYTVSFDDGETESGLIIGRDIKIA